MSSETVDPIDWPLYRTFHRKVPQELHLHGANACDKSQQLINALVECERATFEKPGHRTTWAAIQGILLMSTNK